MTRKAIKNLANKIPKGYQRPGYNWGDSIRDYKATRQFHFVKDGSGHRAGEAWGDAKQIDPNSLQRRYSKNSPSFDEGVWLSKQRRKVLSKMTQAMKTGESMQRFAPLYQSVFNQTESA